MNKLVKSLTVAALTISASVYAHTEHTYLQTRPQGVNLPMEYTTFNERMTSKLEDRFGGNFMVTGFYSYSADKNGLGEYFGIAGKNEFVLGQAADVTAKTADFDLARVIHGQTQGKATVKFTPKESTYGVRFDYYQNLDKVVKGLYLKVNLPIVNVERDMEMEVSSETAELKDILVNYFKGTGVAQDGSNSVTNARAGLTKGLINGKKSETGVADIDITLGYKVLYNEKYHVGLNLAVTIPTGNDASVDRLFEPIYGNGGHFALGGGVDAQARVWGDREHNIKLNFVANYRYLFEASEYRLPRMKNTSFAYVNIAKDGDHFATPAADKLTLNCDVTPGSMFDGILGLAYNKGGFSADLGYNLYFRQDEDVDVKGKVEEGLYVVPTNWDTATVFAHGSASALTNDSLDMESASTQSQFTNGVYAALGYTYKEWEYPLMLGIGGKYDFAAKNSAIEQWQVWGKASLSF